MNSDIDYVMNRECFADIRRMAEWLTSGKPAAEAFPSGPERELADVIEPLRVAAKARKACWTTSPLDDGTLDYIARQIDHDVRWNGLEVGEMMLKWNNRAAGMLLKTIEYYREHLTAANLQNAVLTAKCAELEAALEDSIQRE